MASTPTLSHRAEYVALRAVIRSLEGRPLADAAAIGGRLGMLGYRPFGIRRRVVERQVAAAFPTLDDASRRRIARGAYENLGRVSAEAPALARSGAAGILGRVSSVQGWEVLEEARALGRGLIVIGGHLGNWELTASYIAARGIPIDAVTRRLSNPLVERYVTRMRTQLGMTVVQDTEAVRRCMRTLQGGGSVGFLIDQGVLNVASTWVPFFGRPAKTPRGPAVFALRFDTPMLFTAILREPDGSYRLHYERVPISPTGDRERDVDTVVATYTATLERYVRLSPEQYFWQHRRWKWQPEDTPAHLRDPSA